MQDLMIEISGPLERHSEEEIEHLLRGFSKTAISSALALRTECDAESLDRCLFGILTFYLPPGTRPPQAQPSADTRLRDELGLDSLSMAEAMFKIEELFDICVDNSELSEVVTIADARRLLMEKLESSSQGTPDE